MKVFFLLYFCLVFSGSVWANSLDELIVRAQKNNLAQHVTWQRLLYLENHHQSEVKYADFFLAKNGAQDAEQELIADLTALFDPQVDQQSFQCRFPARRAFLIQQLNIQADTLPQIACPEFEKWISEIQPHHTVLVYATDFMGNPSSMFGHTLLRFDPKDQQQLNLVSYAVNYAATVAEEGGWAYALKGLTGQYGGEYSLMPYYYKVKEYGDLESRDLWEYQLNLSPEQTHFLLSHIWEMQHVSFPYYFVSDNCAYRLLGLLDIVRADLNLKQQFKHTSVPVETIKALADANLIQQQHYRPALATQLQGQAAQYGQKSALNARQLSELSIAEMDHQLQMLPEDQQAHTLEMAYDHLYLQLLAHQVDGADAQPKLRHLLWLRSQQKKTSSKQPVQPKFNPLEGHHTRQLKVAAADIQHDSVLEISHRLAYHDLLDPQQGYRMGTQLKFLDFALQLQHNQIKLSQFDVFSVHAYNPISAFERPWSWGMDIAWQQEVLAHDQNKQLEQHGVFNLQARAGYSFTPQFARQLCFAQLQPQLQFGKSLDQGWRIGAAPVLGCQQVWTKHWQSLVEVELPFWSTDNRIDWSAKTNVQYAFDVHSALRFDMNWQQHAAKTWREVKLSYVHYY